MLASCGERDRTVLSESKIRARDGLLLGAAWGQLLPRHPNTHHPEEVHSEILILRQVANGRFI